jgi:hypothetical protein
VAKKLKFVCDPKAVEFPTRTTEITRLILALSHPQFNNFLDNFLGLVELRRDRAAGIRSSQTDLILAWNKNEAVRLKQAAESLTNTCGPLVRD